MKSFSNPKRTIFFGYCKIKNRMTILAFLLLKQSLIFKTFFRIQKTFHSSIDDKSQVWLLSLENLRP